MQNTIVITDLTQMPIGNRVCVVGIDRQKQCIRLFEDDKGVLKEHLFIGGKLVIRPKAKIKCDFHTVSIRKPHIEDLGFDPNSTVYQGLCNDIEWETVLQDSSFSTVDDIFDGLLQQHRWVKPRANTRSIGTLSQAKILAVELPLTSGKLKCRLLFQDKTGFKYNNPITDLAFWDLSYREVKKRSRDTTIVAQEIMSSIATADRVYLRLGLARPYSPSNGSDEPRCWLQVTGIYTFPDYLKGKSFIDFQSTQ